MYSIHVWYDDVGARKLILDRTEQCIAWLESCSELHMSQFGLNCERTAITFLIVLSSISIILFLCKAYV